MSAQGSDTSKFDIKLPQSIIDSFARHLVCEMKAFYSTDEGKQFFEDWLSRQNDTKDAES